MDPGEDLNGNNSLDTCINEDSNGNNKLDTDESGSDINGDGETSRDFCFIDNVVQANLLAAVADKDATNQVYNIALGDRITLNELFIVMKNALQKHGIDYIGVGLPQGEADVAMKEVAVSEE